MHIYFTLGLNLSCTHRSWLFCRCHCYTELESRHSLRQTFRGSELVNDLQFQICRSFLHFQTYVVWIKDDAIVCVYDKVAVCCILLCDYSTNTAWFDTSSSMSSNCCTASVNPAALSVSTYHIIWRYPLTIERSIAWWHFQWPWRTPNPVFKVTAFLKSLKNGAF